MMLCFVSVKIRSGIVMLIVKEMVSSIVLMLICFVDLVMMIVVRIGLVYGMNIVFRVRLMLKLFFWFLILC